jgi:hypothetical protein
MEMGPSAGNCRRETREISKLLRNLKFWKTLHNRTLFLTQITNPVKTLKFYEYVPETGFNASFPPTYIHT